MIKESLRQFITTNFYVTDPSELSDHVSLLEQGIIDSTGVLEVIAFLEEAFEVRVEDQEMLPENLESIDAIAAFIERKLGELPEQQAAS